MVQRAPESAPVSEGPPELATLAVVVPWATGPDPGRDELFRLRALVRAGDAWRAFDLFCAPRRDLGEGPRAAAVTRRMQRGYGTRRADLEGAPPAEEAWAALLAFIGGGPVLVARRADLETWHRALGAGAPAPPVLALDEFRDLLGPGRRGPDGTDLRTPEDLLGAFADTLGAFAALPAEAHAVVARLLAAVLGGLERGTGDGEGRAPVAAAALRLALTLVEHPGAWARRPGELPGLDGAAASHADGLFSRALAAWPDPELALDRLVPRWHLPFATLEGAPPLPPVREEAAPLGEADLALLDEVFQAHLPAAFAAPGEAPTSYRAGQREVALAVARSLGRRELLLVHAPTGTGKTLAYLVPLMLWSARNELRTGVATFTRALQDQAIERDVPLARRLLAQAGAGVEPRVVALKGRNAYLCWRALTRMAARAEDAPAEVASWTALLLFALTSPDGDLDAFPATPRLPLPVDVDRRWRSERAALLRQARGEKGCCSSGADRSTCGAMVARRLAERAHVVVTNHSFVLSRREFLRTLVFDECEHLHDGAKSAWSHEFTTGELRRELGALGRPRERRGALYRVLEAAPQPSLVAGAAEGAVRLFEATLGALTGLEAELERYAEWRRSEARTRHPREHHALFTLFLRSDDSAGLVAAHRALCLGLARLDAALSGLLEHFEELPASGRGRLQGRITTARLVLVDYADGLDAWIPRGEDGRPCPVETTFHDVEWGEPGRYRTGRGAREPRLVARVLLPQEDLGSRYLPELEGAVMLSATTRLGGGFETSARYLGLERAAHPRDDEDREPRPFATLAVEEVFDYSRVCVAVPRDAPPVGDKDAFLDYTTRFLEHLAVRTRGRVLALFTNANDLERVGRDLERRLAAAHLECLWQGMGARKEELAERFRRSPEATLLGLDTFWYGADFPGETLEYLVIARLPFGVPDDYHHAQSAALGSSEQRKAIYLPRALARFRQGFGRLLRREKDRGAVFVLDKRLLEPRQRAFLRELPLVEGAVGAAKVSAKVRPASRLLADDGGTGAAREGDERRAQLVRGDTDRCIRAALAHMEMLADVRGRGLDTPFGGGTPSGPEEGSDTEAGGPGGLDDPRRGDAPPDEGAFFPTDLPAADWVEEGSDGAAGPEPARAPSRRRAPAPEPLDPHRFRREEPPRFEPTDDLPF